MGTLKSENFVAARRPVQWAHIARETEAQSKQRTQGPVEALGWQFWFAVLYFLSPHLGLGTNIMVSAKCHLDLFILSSQVINPLWYNWLGPGVQLKELIPGVMHLKPRTPELGNLKILYYRLLLFAY